MDALSCYHRASGARWLLRKRRRRRVLARVAARVEPADARSGPADSRSGVSPSEPDATTLAGARTGERRNADPLAARAAPRGCSASCRRRRRTCSTADDRQQSREGRYRYHRREGAAAAGGRHGILLAGARAAGVGRSAADRAVGHETNWASRERCEMKDAEVFGRAAREGSFASRSTTSKARATRDFRRWSAWMLQCLQSDINPKIRFFVFERQAGYGAAGASPPGRRRWRRRPGLSPWIR